MIIRRKVLNMNPKMWDRLDEIFGTEKCFEVTPNEFLHIIGLPNALSSYLNPDETEFFKQIYTIANKYFINNQEMKTMSNDDKIKSAQYSIVTDPLLARRCIKYFKGCANFDINSTGHGTDKPCMSYSFGCMTITCGEYIPGKPPVLNTSNSIITNGNKNSEMKKNMIKKLTEAQKAEKKNKNKPVVEETPAPEQPVENTEPEAQVEQTETQTEAPVKETKAKKEKAPKTPKGEGAVAKIEAMILKIVAEAGNMTVKAVNEACPSEFNAATWQVRIYHLRKANKLSYNKDAKEVSVV